MNWDMSKEVGLCRYVCRRLAWRWIKLCGGETYPFRLPSGVSLELPLKSPFAADIYCTRGHVDWGAEELALEYLQSCPRGVALDVGANMGYYTVLLAPVAERVFSFEPDPRNHADLQRHQPSNTELVTVAIGNQVGEAGFDVSSGPTVGHLVLGSARRGDIQVPMTTLDAFCESANLTVPVRFIKMDIEGYEILALQGSRRLIQKYRPVCLIEYSLDAGVANTPEALAAFVSENDYSVYAMVRKERGTWHYETLLRAIRVEDLPHLNVKMLFLVPSEDTFFSKAQARGFCFERDVR
jgi:FkbM family methyltransferase